jgi:protein O-GlcNAc transferase
VKDFSAGLRAVPARRRARGYAGRQPIREPPMHDPAPAADALVEAGALLASGRLDEAEAAYRAVAESGRAAEVVHGIGLVRLQRGDTAGALPLLQAAAAISAEPRFTQNLSVALVRAGRAEEAVAALRALIGRAPAYVPAYGALADLLAGGGDPGGAAEALGLLIERAVPAKAGGVIAEAVSGLEKLGRLPETWPTLANMLRIAGRQAETERLVALRLSAEPGCLRARLIRAMNRLAVVHASEDEIDRRRALYTADLEDLAGRVETADSAALAAAAPEIGMAKPFFLSYQGRDDTELQRLYGRIVGRMSAAAFPSPAVLAGPPTGRIRVGFATSYYTLHSVSKLFRGWIERLDRSRFEVIGYQFSADRDPTRDAIAAAADLWRSGTASAAEWRRVIEADRPHALVYLELGMNTVAVQLACQRLAPVQAMAWGHPVTSGFPTVDWFLSSELMEPADGDRHYTERLVRLPGLSICYAPLPSDGGRLTRAGLGLPAEAVVYVCCQSLFKYLPGDDGLFTAIAARVPQARFLFIGDPGAPATAVFRDRLAAAFAGAGLDFARHVTIASPVPPDDFPSLLKAGDVYLDSVGWSGGNTTLEAIACGLPVVTLPTGLMRGRHTAGILRAMGCEEMIAGSRAHYVERAVALADPAARAIAATRIAASRARLWHDETPVRALEDWLEGAVRERTAGSS